MDLPKKYDMPDHFRGDGLLPFSIYIKNSDGDPIDITGNEINLILKDFKKETVFVFSSSGNGDDILSIDGSNGKISLPKINEWDLPATVYTYELKSNDNGFITTYMAGHWKFFSCIRYSEYIPNDDIVIDIGPTDSPLPTPSNETFIIL